MGFLVARRITLAEAFAYWVAQFVGGIVGAAVLLALFNAVPSYSTSTVGLGTNGYANHSLLQLSVGGAFLAETVLTFLFVFVVLAVTRRAAWPQLGGIAIGLALTVVHLIGIPLTGTSVNPARSMGPALMIGGAALSQLWLFIVAPLLGGVLAGAVSMLLYPGEHLPPDTTAAEPPGGLNGEPSAVVMTPPPTPRN
jgi:aquaporin Z